MTRSIDVIRLTSAGVNLGVWLPWIVVVIFAAPNWWQLVSGGGLAVLGLSVAAICCMGKPRWELHALLPLAVLLVWVILLFLNISNRQLHADSGCVPCSLIDWRIRTASLLIDRGSYLLAFNVLWYDFILPVSVLLTLLIIFTRIGSRLLRAREMNEANAT